MKYGLFIYISLYSFTRIEYEKFKDMFCIVCDDCTQCTVF